MALALAAVATVAVATVAVATAAVAPARGKTAAVSAIQRHALLRAEGAAVTHRGRAAPEQPIRLTATQSTRLRCRRARRCLAQRAGPLVALERARR